MCQVGVWFLEGVWKVCGRCLEGVWKTSGGAQKGVCKMSGGLMKSAWKVCGVWIKKPHLISTGRKGPMCLEDVLKLSESCLEGA